MLKHADLLLNVIMMMLYNIVDATDSIPANKFSKPIKNYKLLLVKILPGEIFIENIQI